MSRPKKPCPTPGCDGVVTYARACKACYEARRAYLPKRILARVRYDASRRGQEVHRRARAAYRARNPKPKKPCADCGLPCSQHATRCVKCYQARVLPRARARGLAAIHGPPKSRKS